ncbi:ROK family transcriptional regulator [Variovorax sp. AFSI2.2]|uniref:ROK family transcriptional regulator n=1 Tax=Variovorax sp. AFSI2.2 TaxID=3384160 RepID=UPI003EB9992F
MTADRQATTLRPQFLRREGASPVNPNERALLDAIRRSGTISRADLTRASGLSAPGAKALIDSLSERQLIELGTPSIRGRGQPSASVTLAPDFAYCIGTSVMVDGFGVTLSNFSGQLLETHFTPTFPMRLAAVATGVRKSVGMMLRKHRIDPEKVFGMGLSMTGPFIGSGSRVNPPLSMPEEWMQEELDAYFRARLEMPVWLDNDANCAAIAESLFGVGRWASNFVYLHFTDGLGGGVIKEGRVVKGSHGNAGELGRIFPLTGLKRPSLEGLRQQVAQRGRDVPNIEAMLAIYDPEWPEIEAWLDEVGPGLSIVIAAIAALCDPQAVVFGARLPSDLAHRLIAKVDLQQQARRDAPMPDPRLVVSEGPRDAASIGAANLPFKEHFFL